MDYVDNFLSRLLKATAVSHTEFLIMSGEKADEGSIL